MAPPEGKKVGLIANALDFTGVDEAKRDRDSAVEARLLEELGFSIQHLDLRAYFGQHSRLCDELLQLGGVWIRGGNCFILRQAMHLSGFDQAIRSMHSRSDFLYSGYSAAGCVLSPSLSVYAIVDNPNDHPYPELRETIWEGLSVLEYAFMPHYDSTHFESAVMGQEIQRCIERKQLFKALRDGDALVGETDDHGKLVSERFTRS
jgi:dipeptidase E